VAEDNPVRVIEVFIDELDLEALGFAGVVRAFDVLPDGAHKRVVEQGLEMGRPSRIEVEADVRGGSIGEVRVGGQSVVISEGHLIVPD